MSDRRVCVLVPWNPCLSILAANSLFSARYPTSVIVPKSKETAGKPKAFLYAANESMKADPAAYAACVAFPMTPLIEESMTKKSKLAGRCRCRFQVPLCRGRRTALYSSAVIRSIWTSWRHSANATINYRYQRSNMSLHTFRTMAPWITPRIGGAVCDILCIIWQT